MTSGMICLYRSLCLVCLALIQVVSAADLPVKQNSTQAYVTLLYGDDFLLGVRVLGQSIKDTGTTRYVISEPAQFIAWLRSQILTNENLQR